MFKYFSSIAISAFILINFLLFPSGDVLANIQDPPEDSLSPRNQSYGDPEAKLQGNDAAYSTNLPYNLVVPDTENKEAQTERLYDLPPDVANYSQIVYETLSVDTLRTTIWRSAGYWLGFQSGGYTAFDGNTDSYQPRLHPHLQYVIFTSYLSGNANIYSLPLEGSNQPIQLTTAPAFDGWPVWSPDGNQVAFVSNRDGNSEIYVMNSNGTNQTRLTNYGGSDFSPTWSPNGKQIAWIRQVSNTSGQIWVMNADGSVPFPFSNPLLYLQDVIWSPDGARFALDFDVDVDGFNEAHYMNIQEGLLHLVGDNPKSDSYASSWGGDPDWLIYNRVEYIEYYGQLYLWLTRLFQTDLGPSGIDNKTGEIKLPCTENIYCFVFSADIKKSDHTPPITIIDPLPPYSRAIGFPLIWTAYDSGVGIYDINLFTNELPDGEWNPWATFNQYSWNFPYLSKQYFITGQSGKAIGFLTIGRDYADNLEQKPMQAEMSTTLYDLRVDGAITDIRGNNIYGYTASASNSLNETAGGIFGRFTAFYNGMHSSRLEITSPLNPTLPAAQINFSLDSEVHFVPPPSPNLIVNGDYEDDIPFSSWTMDGTDAPLLAAGHTGDNAIQMGVPCAESGCITSPQSLEIPRQPNPDEISIDSDQEGNLHMLWSDWYYMRDAAGIWHSPVKLIDSATETAFHVWIKVDQYGTVHAVFVNHNTLYHTQKLAGGNWSIPSLIKDPCSDDALDLSANQNGELMLATTNGAHVNVFSRSVDGIWKKDRTIEIDAVRFGNFRTDGTLRLFSLKTLNCTQTISNYGYKPEGLCPAFDRESRAHTGMDDQGISYIFAKDVFYINAGPTEWKGPFPVGPINDYDTAIEVTADGEIWLATRAASQNSSGPFVIFHKQAEENVIERYERETIQLHNFRSPAITTDPNGGIQLVWLNVDEELPQFIGPETAVTQIDTSFEQTFTLNAELHAPTLSFFYKLNGAASGAPETLSVEVIAGEEKTSLFTTGEPTQVWKHVWADLSNWAGQTITVRFKFQNQPGEALLNAVIDDVSVGPWLNPVIKSVTPNDLACPTLDDVTLTLTGQNFIEPAAVTFDGDLLAVKLNDDTTLQATIPAGTICGRYVVGVTNPEGQQDIWEGSVWLHNNLFLPNITR